MLFRTLVGALVALIALPAVANAQARQDKLPMPEAGWNGRAVQNPLPDPRIQQTAWPVGWRAQGVRPGDGYARPSGSARVKDLQRRLRSLGYRPGPVDGRFGPRTRAATRWFQYKHGLKPDGRVGRATLAVLQARSDHIPLTSLVRTSESAEPANGSGGTAAPGEAAAQAVPVSDGGNSDELWLFALAVLAAMAAGLAAGTFGEQLRPRPDSGPRKASTALAPAQRGEKRTQVFGYITLNSARQADAAIPALLTLCANRGWSLARILHDPEPVSGRILDRPGLGFALRAVSAGAADGIIVARLHDISGRFADLAALLRDLDAAGGFLAAVDEPFDTSTPMGRATADAIVELASSPVLPPGRFTRPADRRIATRLATLRARGLPPRAIADALNLARIPTPSGHALWRPAGVDAAIDHEHET